MAAFLRRVGEIFMLVHSNAGEREKTTLKMLFVLLLGLSREFNKEWQKLNAKKNCGKLHWAGHKGQI